MEEKQQQEIDLNKVYEYAGYSYKISRRYDNWNSAYFKIAFSLVGEKVDIPEHYNSFFAPGIKPVE
ncbi:hypothetical protein [Priestia megaterium]|uniref:hypothetical protein n=1 Tax=Priestia megaterium TaxID=1404 RepID=UPI0023DA2EF0|nr:hypothetical protein [Priestia megaterium]MDF2012297.1 hypothetical protein [Priestia megaterium]